MDEKIFFILCFYQAIEPTYSSVDLGVKNRCRNPAYLPHIKKCFGAQRWQCNKGVKIAKLLAKIEPTRPRCLIK